MKGWRDNLIILPIGCNLEATLHGSLQGMPCGANTNISQILKFTVQPLKLIWPKPDLQPLPSN
jgi:hypothetical protein